MTVLEEVLRGKYPAKAHAQKVAKWMKEQGAEVQGTLYLEGQKTRMIEDNDEPMPFRQRRYFFYLTGCQLPDCYFTYDLKTQKSTLFIPPIDPDDVMWSGLPITPAEALNTYDVDAVLLSTEVNAYLASSSSSKTTVYAIHNQVSDDVTFLSYNETDFKLLKPAIEIARVTKSPYEIALIRRANAISTTAHTAVMRAVSYASNEQELEAVFLKNCVERGAKEQAYHSIVASGTSAATLHYVKNDQSLYDTLNVLLDAGCEVDCYASDVTRTFPRSGTFSPESLAIYNIVLDMQKQCTESLKAGIKWDDVHLLAHKIVTAGLLELGIFCGGSVDEILAARTSVAFFPHGLGHYLGMDTHDTGGNPNYEDTDPMFRYLRVRGTLPAGSVITVEPGCYFCRFIIDPYLKDEKQSKYIDEQVLERYWSVGGVRIEDNILITEGGYENLTPTPKEVEEMGRIIRGEA